MRGFTLQDMVMFGGQSGDPATDSRKLIISTDEGVTWEAVGPYVALKAIAIGGTTIFAVANSATLYKSTDSGQTWSEIATGLEPLQEIACSQDAATVLVTAKVDASNYKLYMSTDGGDSFTQKDSTRSRWALPRMSGDAAVMIADINYTHGGVPGIALIISTDGGDTWTVKTNTHLPATGSPIYVDAALNQEGSVIFLTRAFAGAGNSQALRSDDDLSTLDAVPEDEPGELGWWVVSCDDVGDAVLFGRVITNAGLWHSTDQGATSDKVLAASNIGGVRLSGDAAFGLVITNTPADPRLSTDGGATWTAISGLGTTGWQGLGINGDGSLMALLKV